MNGSELASTTASSPKSKEDPVVNGHDEKENNPFAEYMWMENEEDFNRQGKWSVCPLVALHGKGGSGKSHPVCVGPAWKDVGWMELERSPHDAFDPLGDITAPKLLGSRPSLSTCSAGGTGPASC
ncbi:polyadenylate-binding protein-interacting protein 2B isoform X2 [Corapipo altera]|uniref:polyadenylate-binding protein-interacting protein 2B isoform X2 n=1 Tax=Corapipo altera TaxID=415028 RepID=UPI000FD64326|nr:polyadenylate-binding protein-interacting protein 2B isoform X2 [Corapipo altera]